MKSLHPACVLVLPALFAGGCTVTLDSQSQIARAEKQFTVSGTPEVHVTTFDGAIEIQSWDKPGVLIQIEKRGPTREAVDALEIRSTQDGNRVELEVKKPRQDSFTIGFHQSASAKLVVSVPRNAAVIARRGDGSIQIAHVTGRVELHTGDGSIRAEDVSGTLALTTGDGSVTVDGAEGRLELETGDGSVNVTGDLAAVRLHTGDGSIVYRARQGVSMDEDWDISTGDGTVSLYLPPTFGAEIDAHTGNGRIGNDLAIASPSPAEGNRHTLKGRLGSGGKQLRIRTGDGSIRLRPL